MGAGEGETLMYTYVLPYLTNCFAWCYSTRLGTTSHGFAIALVAAHFFFEKWIVSGHFVLCVISTVFVHSSPTASCGWTGESSKLPGPRSISPLTFNQTYLSL